MVTPSGDHCAPWRSPLLQSGSSTISANLPASPRTASAVSLLYSANSGQARNCSVPSSSSRTNRRSLTGARYITIPRGIVMYRAPVKDLRFVLDELLGTEQLRACPEFAEYSSETADAVRGEAGRFAEIVLEPLCKSGDRQGAQWSPDGVTMPEGFREA